MNAVVVGKTSRLVPIIQLINVDDVVYSVDGEGKDMNTVICDHVPPDLFEKVFEKYRTSKIVYVYNARNGLGADYERSKEACKLKEIPFIVDRTDHLLQEEIESILFPEHYAEKVQPSIRIVGCHRRVGHE